MRESPLPSRRFACWLPPEARVVDDDAGNGARQLPVQVAGDLLAGALTLALRDQADRHLRAAAATASPPPPPKPPPARSASRCRSTPDVLLGEQTRAVPHVLIAFDARADRQLRADS
jgi:hypothetical protein